MYLQPLETNPKVLQEQQTQIHFSTVSSSRKPQSSVACYFGGETINLAPCGNVTVFGLLQTGQVTLTFVSGVSAEGSVGLETLKVFMQFVHS